MMPIRAALELLIDAAATSAEAMSPMASVKMLPSKLHR